jgi:hypothetical protein
MLEHKLEQLALRTPKTFHATSEQDWNPRPCTVNDHPSVLAHEMMTIEPGENPTLMFTWKTTTFLCHLQSRSHDDHFPIPVWETWFCQSLGVLYQPCLKNLDNVLVVNLVLTITVMTFRRVNVYLQYSSVRVDRI